MSHLIIKLVPKIVTFDHDEFGVNPRKIGQSR